MTLAGTHRRPLHGTGLDYFSIDRAAADLGVDAMAVPRSTRTMLEGLLRNHAHDIVTEQQVSALLHRDSQVTIPFFPGRILMQDASGIPVLADLITLRQRAEADGLDPARMQPRIPMDLVVDHSLEVDEAGTASAAVVNLEREYDRHRDRYQFLAQAQQQLPSLRVIPPGIGICHQLNLEVLATVVRTDDHDGRGVAALDTLVGTDSHTTMINALSVTGWGVGGIEATAAALGQPIMIANPRVVGVELVGGLGSGVFAADLALHLAHVLRERGVVGAVVEFHGSGLNALSLPDRATVANMAPEYGATMAWFPADKTTLSYLASTGRPSSTVDLAARYLHSQGLLAGEGIHDPMFDEGVVVDLSSIGPTLAGPSRPHDALTPQAVASSRAVSAGPAALSPDIPRPADGDLVIAAITSCTNTSNPRSLVAAGLLAKNAVRAGLERPPWVKASFTPGSRAAAELLARGGLQEHLDELGFTVAGFGCGTCMGNSGPLEPGVSEVVTRGGATVSAVLSGNRNFTGRVHPDVTNSYLASPAMVVAYALLGHVRDDVSTAALSCHGADRDITLADLWPSEHEIDTYLDLHGSAVLAELPRYPLTSGRWEQLQRRAPSAVVWQDETGAIRRPPFAEPKLTRPLVSGDIRGARALLVLGDAVTTDHISPVSRVLPESAAGRWLLEHEVPLSELGTFSSRRLNHDVMLRGGFANHRLTNLLCPDEPGGRTALDGEVFDVHQAARRLAQHDVPAVIVAGKLYGAGSARDWAAKVTRLLGVRAVIAQSFERIHRTNLVALGVLPVEAVGIGEVAFDGSEEIDIVGLDGEIRTRQQVAIRVRHGSDAIDLIGTCRLETPLEVHWLQAGGIMAHLLHDAREGEPH